MTIEIETIKPEKAQEIINLAVKEMESGRKATSNLNLYLAKDGEKYIAIDNKTGDCLVEEFYSLYVANCWLLGTMDTEEAYEIDINIWRIADIIKTHPWYENETIEKCREFAEYQIMKLREGAKRNEKTR